MKLHVLESHEDGSDTRDIRGVFSTAADAMLAAATIQGEPITWSRGGEDWIRGGVFSTSFFVMETELDRWQ